MAQVIDWYVDGSVYQTTTCNSGDSITPPTAPAKYGYTFLKWNAYIPIEYLESTGTQWIDTGYAPNNHTVVKAKGVLTRDSGFLFGSRTDAQSRDRYGFLFATDTQRYRSDFYNGNAYWNSETPIGESIVIYKDKNICHITTSAGDTYSVTNSEGVFVSGWNMYLFACNTSGAATLAANAQKRIYYLQIEEGDTLVRNFIPVLDSSGVPCMYDRVTRQFFYNQGTGQFIAGPRS